MMKHILIAEDEAPIRTFIGRGLTDCGYRVSEAADGSEALAMLRAHDYDLLILDIRMPAIDGAEVCRRLRAERGYGMPVVMLTALGTTDDIVMGLRAGADDYVVKPFKFVELLARIESLLRRTQWTASHQAHHYADLRLDPASHRAFRGEVTIELSAKEYRLLDYMITHHDQVLTRERLLCDVWDKDFDPSTNVVDVYVRYLRAKVDQPFEHRLIHTLIGEGYILRQ